MLEATRRVLAKFWCRKSSEVISAVCVDSNCFFLTMCALVGFDVERAFSR